MNFSQIGIIFKKEMSSYFNSAVAYVLMVVFLAIVGWFYVNNIFLYGTAALRPMFELIPLIFLFIIPAITMRLLSEEKKSGTFELLATKPIADSDIIMGKFFAAWTMIAVTLLPTVLYWFTISTLGDLDHGPVIGAYLGLLFSSAVYLSAGLLASSLSNNQIVAFILGFIFVFILFILDETLLFLPAWLTTPIEFIGVDYHYQNIARGVIDTRDVIYFLSAIGIIIYLTIISLERRRW